MTKKASSEQFIRQLKKSSKTFLIIWIMCLYASKADSQVIIALLFGDKLNSEKLEFGLSGGLNQSNISNLPDTKSKSGLNLGLYLNIKLKNRWDMRVEAVPKFPTGISKLEPYSLNNSSLDSLLQYGSVTRKIKNIALPVMIRYKITDLFCAEAGPQLNLRTKAKDVFESGDLSYDNKIEDDITRFDFGFAFGLNQKLSKGAGALGLGARYYIGLTDIDKLTPGSQKNGVFQMLLSIPVGAGKRKSKAQSN